jgi:DNA-binding protein H-NS
MLEYKGKEADRLVARIDPGVVPLVAEPRSHERQAAEEIGQRKTRVGLQEALSAATIAREISSRNAARRGAPKALRPAAAWI